MMLREKMEILIFALIASYNGHRRQERVVAEPEEFQPFDLQALRNSADNKPSRSLSRREEYVSDSKLNATESPKLFATEKKSRDIIVLLLE